jgi:N-acetylglucosaminyldiphosphoundecaprenol N-acetyl-beta-D-mannosaminyltransferase
MTSVFGINFSPLGLSALIAQFTSGPLPEASGPQLVVTANMDHIVNLTRSSEFRCAYYNARVATADGMPVYLYAKLRGIKLPCRVTGADLFEALMQSLSPKNHRAFFIVSRLSTGAKLKDWLVKRGFDESSVEVACPPFGFEKDIEYSAQLSTKIKEHLTTHLVLGVGSPKSEVWVENNKCRIGNCYAFGLGAGLDFFVGAEKRAPLWMRRVGTEWLWRFGREPKRLFRRYFIDSWRFFYAIMLDCHFIRRQSATGPSFVGHNIFQHQTGMKLI